MGTIIYSKYSNDRAPKYMIATHIIREGDKQIVRKSAVNVMARDHVMAMKEHYDALSKLLEGTGFIADPIVGVGEDYIDFEYIEGRGFEEYLDGLLDAGEYEQLIQAMGTFFDALNAIAEKEFEGGEVFEHLFGECKNLSGYRCISVGDIDLIFQNVIIGKNDKWNVIDYEWTADCYIPVKFLIFRAIFLYIYGRSNRSVLIERNLFDIFGISEREMEMFACMEERFQNTIKEGCRNLGDYYQYMGMPAENSQVAFEKNERQHFMRVYYDHGDGFADDKRVFADHNARVYVDGRIKALRIEPVSMDCLVHVNNISDNNGNAVPYSSNGKAVDGGSLLFTACTPYILLENIPDACEYIDVDMAVSAIDPVDAGKISSMQDARTTMEKDINNIYNSGSWRITAPMRAVFGGINNVASGISDVFVGHGKPSVVRDGLKYLSRNGIRSTVRRTIEFCKERNDIMSEENFTLTKEQVELQRDHEFEYTPLISILVPLYNTPKDFLKEMIDSVRFQTYENWELCLADGSDEQHTFVGDICKEYAKNDDRIVYEHLAENRGISDNTNECMKMATGEFIGLFDHDDLLTQDALFEVVEKLNEDRSIGALYTDEDKYLYDSRKKTGTYVQPFFKPDFNLDLLRSCNYICHFFVVKKSIADEVGGFRHEFDGSQDFDFIFRCSEKAGRVAHVPKILYHWRIHANSTAASPENKMYCYEAGRHAIEEHLKRNGINAQVEITQNLGYYKVKYPIDGEPLVSIIIYNKDNRRVLQSCVDSIISKSTYSNYEIIIVDNNSESDDIKEYYNIMGKTKRVRVEYPEGITSTSMLINYGVKKAKGDYVILLHNDTEVISVDWIEEMLSNCQRKDVGVVGAKLLYKNNTIQHCGKVIGLNGIAGDVFEGLDANHIGYSGRALAQQNLSAVTAACMMTSKDLFDKVGGFEEALSSYYNDVDFCLKVQKEGFLVVLNTYVRLFHNEIKKTDDALTPEEKEIYDSSTKYMSERWKDILEKGDPYYNRNLTLMRNDFSRRGRDEA